MKSKSDKNHSTEKWDGQRETLDDLGEAVHYNRWIFHMIEPFLGKRIMEVGCGTGNITGYLAQGREVLALDMHRGYLDSARRRWGRLKNVAFHETDLRHGLKNFQKFKPDTLVSVNVLEHIGDDNGFLSESFRILPPGGRVLVFVPAFQWLYGSMDKSYGHQRRYQMADLTEKLRNAGFEIQYWRYLNLLGILGWWLNGKVFRRAIIPKSQMMFYNALLRWVAPVEKFLPKPVGLSLLAVGVKRKPAKS